MRIWMESCNSSFARLVYIVKGYVGVRDKVVGDVRFESGGTGP